MPEAKKVLHNESLLVRMTALCVFCGSSTGANGAYLDAARTLGSLIVQQRITLVFGGGNVGLMGVLADTVIDLGGKAIGVMPKMLVEREVAHTRLSKLHVVRNMHERKALMYRLSDAFLALPGGVGTLDELFEVLTWQQLGIHHKPVGILNLVGYFDHLTTFLHHAAAQLFIPRESLERLVIDQRADVLLERLHKSGSNGDGRSSRNS